LKEEAPETVVAAVQGAVWGEGYFSPPVANKMAAWARGELPGGLTERELDVLQLVAQGLSNKEVALTLKVKKRTVEFHMGNILKKLEVASRVEAAMWAKDHGIVPRR
jgi:DNA-binding NarL/FixJ family response regulator